MKIPTVRSLVAVETVDVPAIHRALLVLLPSDRVACARRRRICGAVTAVAALSVLAAAAAASAAVLSAADKHPASDGRLSPARATVNDADVACCHVELSLK